MTNKANQSAVCPECGAKLPADAASTGCPHCIFGLLLSQDPQDGDTVVLSLQDIPRPGVNVTYVGDYELLEVIAQGGMGVVYKARQKSLNRIVALKMLLGGAHANDDFKQRFRHEAETVSRLQHPNIVPVYEVGEHEGSAYFSMEYVAGQDLAKLTNEQPMPPKVAAEHVLKVAQALAYAHQQGVLHRDLKPSNVLIGPDNRPRVTDFGLAGQMNATSNLTISGGVLGTPGYLPPEQVSVTRGAIGTHSDVYSMGAILYHLLTGRPPFMAGSVIDTLRKVVEEEAVSVRQLNAAIPIDLESICMKCLEKGSKQRYESAQALADDLEKFLQGRPILARRIGRMQRAWMWARRNPLTAGLSVAILLSGLTGMAGMAWQWQQGQHQKTQISDDTRAMASLLGDQVELLGDDADPVEVTRAFDQLMQERVHDRTNGLEAAFIRECCLYALLKKGFFAPAEPVARQLLSFYEQADVKHTDGEAKDLATARVWLGISLAHQGKNVEAEPLLVSGCTEIEHLWCSHPDYLAADFLLPLVFSSLAQLYADTGHSHLAADYQFRLGYYLRNQERTDSAGKPFIATNLWQTPACFAQETWLLQEYPDTRPGAPENTNGCKILQYNGSHYSNVAGSLTNEGVAYADQKTTLWVMWDTDHRWLVLHPGKNNNGVAIAFTASHAGTYHLTGAFARQNTDPEGDGVAVDIIREHDTTNTLFSADIPSSASVDRQYPFQGKDAVPFDLKFPLRAGETVRLIVFNGRPGGGNSSQFDSTALFFNLTDETTHHAPQEMLTSTKLFDQILGGN